MRCRGCGAVFAGRRPDDAELAVTYGAYSRDDYDSPITRQRYDELLAGFEPYRQTNRILDMGCGIGFFLEQARRMDWQPCGSEFDARTVEINRKKGLDCVLAPISTEQFGRGYFDVITAFEVVEHLRDPLAEAAVIAHALRDGGLFYCTTPNFGSVSRRLLRDRWSVVSYPEHLSYFTRSTLCEWLARFGFCAVKVTTTGFSLARLHEGIASAPQRGRFLDEELRAQVERSHALLGVKSAINAVLTAAGVGDTIKGHFELRDRGGKSAGSGV